MLLILKYKMVLISEKRFLNLISVELWSKLQGKDI